MLNYTIEAQLKVSGAAPTNLTRFPALHVDGPSDTLADPLLDHDLEQAELPSGKAICGMSTSAISFHGKNSRISDIPMRK